MLDEAKARATDREGQSSTYTASHDPQEAERSSFRGQRQRSQNRSLVRGWGKKAINEPAHRGSKPVKAWRKSLKRRCPGVRVRMESTPKTAPRAAFFCRVVTGCLCGLI